MTVRPRFRHTRKALLTLAAAATLALGGLLAGGSGTPARAAAQGPCDIYASGGTPCVAAHSTTRALYAAYNGPLYQVRRASDNATTNISPLSAGGVANAATQDSFCSGTTCVITEIYDQSGNGNNLTDAPGGGAAGGPDGLANATAAPVTVGGHEAYGVYIAAGDGYRDDSTKNIATGNNPESEYAIFDGTHFNGGCCFDYGNAETNNDDDGAGTMEAIYFGNIKVWGFGSGNGPWIMADMENGLYSGSAPGLNANDPTTTPVHHRHDRGRREPVGHPRRQRPVRLPGHGLQRGAALGLRPDEEAGRDHPRHRRRQRQGLRRHLLRGRHDHRLRLGRHRGRRPGQHRRGRLQHRRRRRRATGPVVSGVSSSACMDNNNGSGANGNKVQIWACDGYAPAQNWTVNANGTITIDGGCLDITGANYNNGTLVELWTCNGGANQQWKAQNGALVNPTSGKCLDDPNGSTTNGTQLQIWSCSGASNQKWTIP